MWLNVSRGDDICMAYSDFIATRLLRLVCHDNFACCEYLCMQTL